MDRTEPRSWEQVVCKVFTGYTNYAWNAFTLLEK